MEDREKEVEEYLNRKRRKENIVGSIKILFMFISWIVGIVCCILLLIYRIKNPHLTETELMLYSLSHYWWVYLLVIISTLINNK